MLKYDVALIILYDDDHKFLLQHRTDDAPTHPGYWGFFGGGIDPDETPEEAVKREAKEELDYILEKIKLVYSQKNADKNRQGKNYYFIEKCANKNLLKLNEGQGMDWFNIKNIDRLKISLQDKLVLQKIKSEF